MLWCRLWEVNCSCCYIQKDYVYCYLIYAILCIIEVTFVNYDCVQCISIHHNLVGYSVLDNVQTDVFTSSKSAQYVEILRHGRKQTSRNHGCVSNF